MTKRIPPRYIVKLHLYATKKILKHNFLDDVIWQILSSDIFKIHATCGENIGTNHTTQL